MGTVMATAQLDRSALDALRGGVRYAVLSPGDVDYDDARALYNAMIDSTRRSSSGATTWRT
jgi:hypothetical protein